MTISFTIHSPNRAFNACITPSFTIMISFLTTDDVKLTNNTPLDILTFLVREAIICPTTSFHILQTSLSLNFWYNPVSFK